MYSTGGNCVFIWKLFNKRTADEYDGMFGVQFDRLFESKAESQLVKSQLIEMVKLVTDIDKRYKASSIVCNSFALRCNFGQSL